MVTNFAVLPNVSRLKNVRKAKINLVLTVGFVRIQAVGQRYGHLKRRIFFHQDQQVRVAWTLWYVAGKGIGTRRAVRVFS